MTNLNCNANTCTHNSGNLCAKGSIDVSGASAKSATATCCSSFCERQSGFENSVQSATETVDICCKADTCSHNASGKCGADHVDISGFGADAKGETNCSSFVCK